MEGQLNLRSVRSVTYSSNASSFASNVSAFCSNAFASGGGGLQLAPDGSLPLSNAKALLGVSGAAWRVNASNTPGCNLQLEAYSAASQGFVPSAVFSRSGALTLGGALVAGDFLQASGRRLELGNSADPATPWRLDAAPQLSNLEVQSYAAASNGYVARMLVTPDGKVGIGIGSGSAPAATLHVAGDILATGDVVAFSDARIKCGLRPVTDALAKVQALNGYTFRFLPHAPGAATDALDRATERMGLIAQEVERVAPQLVHTVPMVPPREGMPDIKSVAYGNMAALFVEALKELVMRVDALGVEARHAVLVGRIKSDRLHRHAAGDDPLGPVLAANQGEPVSQGGGEDRVPAGFDRSPGLALGVGLEPEEVEGLLAAVEDLKPGAWRFQGGGLGRVRCLEGARQCRQEEGGEEAWQEPGASGWHDALKKVLVARRAGPSVRTGCGYAGNARDSPATGSESARSGQCLKPDRWARIPWTRRAPTGRIWADIP